MIFVASNSFSDAAGNFNQDGNDSNNSLTIAIAPPAPKPEPTPEPAPAPISYTTSFFGNAAAGSSSISLSNGSQSLSQGSLESNLGLALGTLDTNLNGTKTQINATEGSAFKISYKANIGDTISFNYNFNSSDSSPYNDFSFYSINGKTFSLAALGEKGVGSGSTKASFSHTVSASDLTASNTFNLAVGVVDALDYVIDTNLTITNFSIKRNSNFTQIASLATIKDDSIDTLTGSLNSQPLPATTTEKDDPNNISEELLFDACELSFCQTNSSSNPDLAGAFANDSSFLWATGEELISQPSLLLA